MSYGYASKRLASARTFAAVPPGGTGVAAEYIRPIDWLALPAVAHTENKIVGLFAVYDEPNNFVSMIMSISGGYTVDWGDGVIENFAGNAQANHQYVYANISNDTLTTTGYKQVIVTVTPQTGSPFSTINFNAKHPTLVNVALPAVPWLDMTISAPTMTGLTMTGVSAIVTMLNLQKLTILSGNIGSGQYKLVNLSGLRKFHCDALITQTAESMFQGCSALIEVNPLTFSTVSKVLSTTNMFNACSALISAPDLDTQYCTTMNAMFTNCVSLKNVPTYNMAAATTTNSMFNNCIVLVEVPDINIPNVTDAAAMFASCSNLKSVSLTTSNKLTTCTSIFAACKALVNVSVFDTSAVTSFQSVFESCLSISTIPAFNAQASNFFTDTFATCRSLTSINITNVKDTATFVRTFSNAGSLSRLSLVNIGQTFAVAGSLSSTSLNEIYTNLATVVGKTITVSGNYGVNADDPSIATAKGWTVTG